jgi:beta-lactamase regulating signal transducer with metallopeptidase domain
MWFSKMTHFHWMRAYLLVSLILSASLPFLTIPITWFSKTITSDLGITVNQTFTNLSFNPAGETSQSLMTTQSQMSILKIFGFAIVSLYLTGAAYQLFKLARDFLSIFRNIRSGEIKKLNKYQLVYLKNYPHASNFFKFIFLDSDFEILPKEDKNEIIAHEVEHAGQFHSLDLLFVEVMTVLFWFNPAMKYLKKALQDVHEYQVDEKLSKNDATKHSYSQLLLRLSTKGNDLYLSSAFSAKQINLRLNMIGRPRSRHLLKFSFLLIIPLASMLLISFSCLDHDLRYKDQVTIRQGDLNNEVGNIRWVGNTVFTDRLLSNALGVSSGDMINYDSLIRRIYRAPISPSSLYLDNGYLFFHLDIDTVRNEYGALDLTFNIYEGNQAKIGVIIVMGNQTFHEHEVFDKITINSGDLFSRHELIKSTNRIKEHLESIVPLESCTPIPKPLQSSFNDEFVIVDLVYEIVEKQKENERTN